MLCQAIIFVVDASDELRFGVAQNELDLLLEHADIQKNKLPVLFYANKSDLPAAYSESDIAAHMQLERITDRPWHI